MQEQQIDITAIVAAIVTFINAVWIIYSAWKKNKPEVKKLEYEADSEMVEAAEINLQGAKLSGEILMARILELKNDLEIEKKSRKEEADYFRRRLKEAERESRDYRIWAAKLAKQVIEAGQIPAAFIPSSGDSEPFFPTSKAEEKYSREVEILKGKQHEKDEKDEKEEKELNDKQQSDTG